MNLRRLRERAGMTQEELVERSGVSVRTVRRIEIGRGGRPRPSTLQLLADALGLEGAERERFTAGLPIEDGPPREREEPTLPEALVEAAHDLAVEVRARWRDEEEQRGVQDPIPLPVGWRPMPAELTDTWANIRRTRKGEAAERIDLSGQLGDIVATYRKVPTGRLVVVGRAGAGKTILTLRFVLDLLKDRAPRDPVPVVFSLESWDPTATTLRDWLTAQLVRDFPELGAPGPGGTTLAAALMRADLLLPVLDGFDEMAAKLQRAALAALNKATGMPLLLTSRTAEYRAAVERIDVLTGAAGVEITDLDAADLEHYLFRSARKTTLPLWRPVLDEIRDPGSTSGKHIAAALATPLMVSLARTVYSAPTAPHPAELLDLKRFPDADAIERHFLDAFVAMTYPREPEDPRFEPEQAQRWLGHLAHQLDRLGTHDIAWWRFGLSMRRRTRMLVMALAVGPVFGSLDVLMESLLLAPTGFVMAFGALFALATGAGFGLAHGLAAGAGRHPFEPARVRIRIRGSRTRPWRAVLQRVRTGGIAGAAIGAGYGAIRVLIIALLGDVAPGDALVVGLVEASVFGLVFGLASGLVLGLAALCEAPLDTESVSSPEALLRASRTAVIVQVLLFGTALALVLPLTGWIVITALQPLSPLLGIPFVWDLAAWFVIGLIGGIGGGTGYALSLTAWGQWLVFARVWLPLTGRMPWAAGAFLKDAYARGALRRAGVVYRFRHERLQRHLAEAYRAERSR